MPHSSFEVTAIKQMSDQDSSSVWLLNEKLQEIVTVKDGATKGRTELMFA